MTHQCRMGYALAIDYLPADPRKSYVTPARGAIAIEESIAERWFRVVDNCALIDGADLAAESRQIKAGDRVCNGSDECGTVMRVSGGGGHSSVQIDGYVGGPLLYFTSELTLLPSEPAATPAQPDADGWVTHDGGPCPLKIGTRYAYVRKNGGTGVSTITEYDVRDSCVWDRRHSDAIHIVGPYMIDVYRVVVPE